MGTVAVRYTHLQDTNISSLQRTSGQQCRRNNGSGAHPIESLVPNLTSEKLIRGIRILRSQSELGSQQQPQRVRYDHAMQRICSRPSASKEHVAIRHHPPVHCEILQRHLSIAVEQEKVASGCLSHAITQGLAMTGVGLVHSNNLRVPRRQSCQDRLGLISAPVVDDDDFQIGHDRRHVLQNLVDGVGEVTLLVVGGKNDREGGHVLWGPVLSHHYTVLALSGNCPLSRNRNAPSLGWTNQPAGVS